MAMVADEMQVVLRLPVFLLGLLLFVLV